jgi:hypothetical protein
MRSFVIPELGVLGASLAMPACTALVARRLVKEPSVLDSTRYLPDKPVWGQLNHG